MWQRWQVITHLLIHPLTHPLIHLISILQDRALAPNHAYHTHKLLSMWSGYVVQVTKRRTVNETSHC
jgi:hypothetical protein